MATCRAPSTSSRTPSDPGFNEGYFALNMVAAANDNDAQAGATAPAHSAAMAQQQPVPSLTMASAAQGIAGGLFDSEAAAASSDVDLFELSDSPDKNTGGVGKRRKQLQGSGPRSSSRGARGGPPSGPPSRSASPRGRRPTLPRPLWPDGAAGVHRMVPFDPSSSGAEQLG